MLGGADGWLANAGFPSELAPPAIPGRSDIPANPGNPAAGFVPKGSPCRLSLAENWAPGGSGTPGGRRLALLPDVLRTFTRSGGPLALIRIVSAGGVAAKLNMPSRTPDEQSVKAASTRGFKKADGVVDFFCMVCLWFGRTGRAANHKAMNRAAAPP